MFHIIASFPLCYRYIRDYVQHSVLIRWLHFFPVIILYYYFRYLSDWYEWYEIGYENIFFSDPTEKISGGIQVVF